MKFICSIDNIVTIYCYYNRKPKGTVTVLVPGGAFEARFWSKNEVKLYLLKRKGFIKLALRHGVDLVPSFSFNEQLIFKQLSPEKGQMYSNFIMITFVSNTAIENKK